MSSSSSSSRMSLRTWFLWVRLFLLLSRPVDADVELAMSVVVDAESKDSSCCDVGEMTSSGVTAAVSWFADDPLDASWSMSSEVCVVLGLSLAFTSTAGVFVVVDTFPVSKPIRCSFVEQVLLAGGAYLLTCLSNFFCLRR